MLTLEYLKSRVKVNEETGCWEWTRYRDKDGYARVTVREKTSRRGYAAHRVMWTLWYGDIPDGLCVCHHCDNPPCVNPEHLFLGTCADNAHDRDAKGRQSHGPRNRGQDHPMTTLTDSDVKDIRDAFHNRTYNTRQFFAMTGPKYEIKPRTIKAIVYRTNWNHL